MRKVYIIEKHINILIETGKGKGQRSTSRKMWIVYLLLNVHEGMLQDFVERHITNPLIRIRCYMLSSFNKAINNEKRGQSMISPLKLWFWFLYRKPT
jgi:hypothetical protein